MAQALFDLPQGQRWIRGYLSGELVRCGEQLFGGDDAGDQAHFLRSGRVDHPPREEQLRRGLWTYDPRQPVQAAEVGDKAALDEQAREARLLGGDDDVAEAGQIHPPAHGRAVDRPVNAKFLVLNTRDRSRITPEIELRRALRVCPLRISIEMAALSIENSTKNAAVSIEFGSTR